MGAAAVEIVKTIPQDPAQVLSVEYDHVIQALASDGTDHFFRQRDSAKVNVQ
jgi:hypothetical protein